PARLPSSGGFGGTVRIVHCLTTFLLLMGMIAPYVNTTTVRAAPAPEPQLAMTLAAAQKPNTPPPLPRPKQVGVAGDFQDQPQIGCQNFDKNCDATQLQPNNDGTWTGSFQINPGDYSFNIVVRGDQGDVALGAGGLPKPDAPDNSLSVPDG